MIGFGYRWSLFWRRTYRLFGGQRLFAAIAVVFVLLLASAVVIFVAEGGTNPEVDGLSDGFRWLVMTAISSPPFEPQTGAGKFAHYFVIVVQPGLMALITGAIASQLVQIVLKRNAGMGRAKVKNHIVICGWSSKGEAIIREIRGRDDLDRAQPLVVLAPLAASPTKDEFTTFISGDPAKDEDLKRAGIEHASTAIILADNSYPGIDIEDMDAKTLLTTLAVESVNPACYTCVEIIHADSRDHFKRTKADELLVTGKLTGALLAHSAVTHGLTRVLNELVSFPIGHEFYWVDASPLAGLSYAEAMTKLKTENDALPIAVSGIDRAEPETNPPATRPIVSGERLLVIAPEMPSVAPIRAS